MNLWQRKFDELIWMLISLINHVREIPEIPQ